MPNSHILILTTFWCKYELKLMCCVNVTHSTVIRFLLWTKVIRTYELPNCIHYSKWSWRSVLWGENVLYQTCWKLCHAKTIKKKLKTINISQRIYCILLQGCSNGLYKSIIMIHTCLSFDPIRLSVLSSVTWLWGNRQYVLQTMIFFFSIFLVQQDKKVLYNEYKLQ